MSVLSHVSGTWAGVAALYNRYMSALLLTRGMRPEDDRPRLTSESMGPPPSYTTSGDIISASRASSK